ncbi:hypothetical protein Ae201684_012208 [Aphanomyces euteiches]|uniref:FYVE-type domain-containing protein n=1 Tax=Aphanomyces euteiches TaxID=100861 RepID=A0A6G0WRY3_9STRA|nr:hypothetical protein Ae201684_012208 [Aphanomyces euteiches]
MMGSQFVSLTGRQRCHLCKRSFGTFRKKRNCFKCGEVVCSKCGPLWNVKAGGTAVKVRARKRRMDTELLYLMLHLESGQISEDCESVDYDTTLVPFTSDDSSMSHYSDSTTSPSHS